jgi:hypothetical protein
MENSMLSIHVVAYLRQMLGIQYVNLERLKPDTTRNVPDGMAYVFSDTFRFVVKILPNNTYVFSPEQRTYAAV